MRDLNESIAANNSQRAEECASDINFICRLERMTPAVVRDIIKNKGLRLYHLEDALRVDKVVLQPSVSVKHNMLDALRGAPLRVGVDKVVIQLKITF
jgi:hypothetical protein